jgi:antitoxin ParD1/3/4
MGGRNISLTSHLSAFIDAAVKSGRHQNSSEVVREALRRYEDDIKAEAASLAAIWAVADQGIAAVKRGDFAVVRNEEDSRELFEQLNREAADMASHRKHMAKPKRRRG